MPIEWPEREEEPPARRARASWWGTIRVSQNDWFSQEAGARRGARGVMVALIFVAALLLLGALLVVYGPLPELFPRDCVGCFFSHA